MKLAIQGSKDPRIQVRMQRFLLNFCTFEANVRPRGSDPRPVLVPRLLAPWRHSMQSPAPRWLRFTPHGLEIFGATELGWFWAISHRTLLFRPRLVSQSANGFPPMLQVMLRRKRASYLVLCHVININKPHGFQVCYQLSFLRSW